MSYTEDQQRQIAEKFAPILHLHPRDMNRPMGVEAFLATTRLLSTSDPSLDIPSPTVDDLGTHNAATTYLSLGYLPVGDDSKSPTGSPITDGYSPAPMYVKIIPEQNNPVPGYNFVRVTYAFFFPSSSFQTARAKILYGAFQSKKRTFPIPSFARHEGDWEHATVIVNDKSPNGVFDIDSVEGYTVFAAQHATEERRAFDQVSLLEGTQRPILYSSLNTHATYFSQQTKTLKNILSYYPASPELAFVKGVDVTDNTSELVTYTEQSIPAQLDPLHTSSGLVLVDFDANAQIWGGFLGKWGGTLNNTIHTPPALPEGAEKSVYSAGKLAISFGLIPSGDLVGKAPSSPARQGGGWWTDEIGYEDLHSVEYGGPHGGSYDQDQGLKLRDYPRVIGGTLRSGSRLDGITLDYSDGSSLTIGGTGGGPQEFTLANGQYINKLELTLGKHSGHTRVFFLRMLDQDGEVIVEGGAPVNAQTHYDLIEAPDDYSIIGFYGRAGEEVDKLGALQLVYQRAYRGLCVGVGKNPFTDYTKLMVENYPRLLSIQVNLYENIISYIAFTYEGGLKVQHGEIMGDAHTVTLPSGEHLTSMALSVHSSSSNLTDLASIKFSTQSGQILSVGEVSGTEQTLTAPGGEVILGLYGSAHSNIEALGPIYVPSEFIE